MTYKVKLIDKKILYHKDLFNDILDETKIFKYQITVKMLLKNTKALKLNFLQCFSVQQQKQ